MSGVQIDSRFSEPPTLFFGIGAQKAGTSWLHSYLNKHPDAAVPRGKELHYWTRDKGASLGVAKRLKAQLKTLREEGKPRPGAMKRRLKLLQTEDPSHKLYADILFKRYTGQKLVGEITPDYADLDRETFADMSALNSDTRFVFLMRDPVERLHSSMRKRLRNRLEVDRGRQFSNEEILEELRALLFRKNSAAVRRSSYDRTIEELEAAVSTDKIGYFFYEDIFEKRSAADICDFLGIEAVPGDFDTKVNPGNPSAADDEFDKAFRTLALERLMPVYQYMEKKFGDRLPNAWKQQMALVDA
ncbi:sulfotransferase [Thalassovita sp.]|uniref:sulfotransferase n=1 Tax=Thalassovita sp. TaxID=1979401 RepID=UPI0029DE55E0|nr:sulfotransferase [Thalassovita sp.]